MRTKAIAEDSLNAILRALTRPNRLACMVSLSTGLRISDVLNIKTEQLRQERFTVTEMKTGKRRRLRLPQPLRLDCLRISGKVYAFPNRLTEVKPRTRQAVWKDLHRVARLFGLKGGIAAHSFRKTYAVGLRKQGLSASQISKALNHSDPCITALYMYADELALK